MHAVGAAPCGDALELLHDGHVVVNASPGNGKTERVSGTIRYLIEENMATPGDFLCFSYTNAAADQLSARIGVEGVQATTIHAWCNGLICQKADGACVEVCMMVREALSLMHTLSPTESGGLRLGAAAPKYIVVDEAQDLNADQFALVVRLSDVWNCKVALVGDCNQSIFGFQGARPELFRDFHLGDAIAKRGCRVRAFKENYRCSEAIVRAANKGLVRMGDDEMIVTRKGGEKPRLWCFEKSEDEVSAVCGEIRSLVADDRALRIAVLNRSNNGLLPFYAELMRNGVDVSLDAAECADGEGGVCALTFHSAKGGSWDAVFLTGCRDDDVDDAEEAAETRRLFHVAFTRPRDFLCVSYSIDLWNNVGGRLTRAIASEDAHLFDVRSGAKTGTVAYWAPGRPFVREPRPRSLDECIDASVQGMSLENARVLAQIVRNAHVRREEHSANLSEHPVDHQLARCLVEYATSRLRRIAPGSCYVEGLCAEAVDRLLLPAANRKVYAKVKDASSQTPLSELGLDDVDTKYLFDITAKLAGMFGGDDEYRKVCAGAKVARWARPWRREWDNKIAFSYGKPTECTKMCAHALLRQVKTAPVREASAVQDVAVYMLAMDSFAYVKWAGAATLVTDEEAARTAASVGVAVEYAAALLREGGAALLREGGAAANCAFPIAGADFPGTVHAAGNGVYVTFICDARGCGTVNTKVLLAAVVSVPRGQESARFAFVDLKFGVTHEYAMTRRQMDLLLRLLFPAQCQDPAASDAPQTKRHKR